MKFPRVLIFRSLFFKIFMWFWLAAAMMFGAWNLMFCISTFPNAVAGTAAWRVWGVAEPLCRIGRTGV